MMETLRKEPVALALLGALQGLAYAGAILGSQGPAGESRAALCAALAAAAAAGGLCAQLAWGGRDLARLAALCAPVAAVFAAITHWVMARSAEAGFAGGDQMRVLTWLLGGFAALYAFEPFAQIYQRSGRWAFPYRELFAHSWANLFTGICGCLFAGVGFVLLSLWAALFRMLGIQVFADLFFAIGFAAPFYSALFGYGLAVGRGSGARLSEAGRSFALAAFRAMLPLLAGIVLLFLTALPFTGLAPLWKTGHASPLLLSLAALLVLFVNAVFEDGEAGAPYWLPVRRAVEGALLALPLLCALTAYSLGLRIAQYGLSPDRVYAALLASVLGGFSLAYAVAVCARTPVWMGAIRWPNTVLAWVVIALALAVHTPLLDPLAWSARSQVRRLLSGAVSPEAFDFAGLTHFGRFGLRELERLRELADHPQAARIRELASAEPPGSGARRLTALAFERIGVPELPGELLQAIGSDLGRRCASRECALFAVDVSGDAALEYCVYTDGYSILCYEAPDPAGPWTRLGTLQAQTGGNPLLEELRRSGARTQPAEFRDVWVGELQLRLEPSRQRAARAPASAP